MASSDKRLKFGSFSDSLSYLFAPAQPFEMPNALIYNRSNSALSPLRPAVRAPGDELSRLTNGAGSSQLNPSPFEGAQFRSAASSSPRGLAVEGTSPERRLLIELSDAQVVSPPERVKRVIPNV